MKYIIWQAKKVLPSSFSVIILLTVLFSTSAFSQSGPDLFSISTTGKGKNLALDLPSLDQLTDRREYDSQPNFINEYQMVFSAADDTGNHDIIVYNFESKKFTNLSKTADRGEFSPTITDCGQYISAVVLEEDGTQKLWLYPTNFEPAELLYDDIEPVGYYDWYNNKAAMFLLGEPNQLVYANGRDDIWTLDSNIGRSIKTRPMSSEIGYLSVNNSREDKEGQALGFMLYDLEKREMTQSFHGLPGSQDFIWLDKNTILMALDNEIFLRNIKKEDWISLGTISSATHQNITRMAYSPDLELLIFAMNRK
ncbi:hypothetical protein [Algoriphagus sediminis]|uniref:WD40 repeat domain-containing protein n=1 Tax=Algoriphagus sediminis TaxID=3057113 RepID=A0ABT7YD77_9BACT|nr:hypothetical protein [Algoriphagus sediminis]MDN3204467.1 hypothetical protein [Algoriphagus sediminis]